jgi:hypothetical protein
MPIATASDASAATQTAAAMRPGLAAVEIIVLSMPVLKRSWRPLTNE